MIYATVTLRISDPDIFKAYAEKAGPALAKYGAKPFAASTAPVRLEGDGDTPTRMVILSFPDRDAAMGWINDPALEEVHALRRASGQSDILLLDA